jgi:hypothetical protein
VSAVTEWQEALWEKLFELIVVPSFGLSASQMYEVQQRKCATIDQVWKIYHSLPTAWICESDFKIRLKSATFIDPLSVETYILTVLKISPTRSIQMYTETKEE